MVEKFPTSRKMKRRAKIEKVALELIAERGFDDTTIDDVVKAAEIGRRTFFRYFASKNELLWGRLDITLERMHRYFQECPADLPVLEATRQMLMEINTYTPEEQIEHRLRVRLVLEASSLQAHSSLRFAEWRKEIARFVAERTGSTEDAILPQTVAHVSLGVVNAALTLYIQSEDSDLPSLIDQGMRGIFDETMKRNLWLIEVASQNALSTTNKPRAKSAR